MRIPIKARSWWHRHWWPAQIRQLERKLHRLDQDLTAWKQWYDPVHREELIRRLANGTDLPPENLIGEADLKWR